MAVKKTVCIDQDDRKYRKNIKVQDICLFLQIEVSTNQDGIYILIFIYGIAIFLKYKLNRKILFSYLNTNSISYQICYLMLEIHINSYQATEM